jgi:hypothetical protein
MNQDLFNIVRGSLYSDAGLLVRAHALLKSKFPDVHDHSFELCDCEVALTCRLILQEKRLLELQQ